MRVEDLRARIRPVKGGKQINIVLTYRLACGDRSVKRRLEAEETPKSLYLDWTPWRISMVDARKDVLALAFGTSNARPVRASKTGKALETAALELHKRLKRRVEDTRRTKAMRARIELRDSREERKEMLKELERTIETLVRRWPGANLRPQDLDAALRAVRDRETVRQVMED